MTRGFYLLALLKLHSASILTTVLGQKLLQTRGQSCSKARSPRKHPTDICLTSGGEVKRRLGGGCWRLIYSSVLLIKRGPHSKTQTLISHQRTGLTMARWEGELKVAKFVRCTLTIFPQPLCSPSILGFVRGMCTSTYVNVRRGMCSDMRREEERGGKERGGAVEDVCNRTTSCHERLNAHTHGQQHGLGKQFIYPSP